ncbi:MAG: endolytic transglycosylase MltG [Bacteroidota bacterium]
MFAFLAPNNFEGEGAKKFEIQSGQSLNAVIDSLYSNDLIPSKTNMHIVAFLYGAERKIKAGKYSIPNGLNYFQLIELLIEGAGGAQTLVTIPEGIWQHDIAELLQDKMKIDEKKFMSLSKDKKYLKSIGVSAKSLEGYLLPNTYYFYDGSTAKEIIKKLKSEMDQIFEREDVKSAINKSKMNKHKILTMASIIDGESNMSLEYKRIAGVYYNRLKKGMRLQADPTVQFLKRKRRSKNKVYYKDLEIDSPYNTYKYRGLPPGPINNPGEDAVMAAIFPEKHNFYYFVADGTGGHKFARNSREHQRNVIAYRKWRNTQ